jgi:hypothetical protein
MLWRAVILAGYVVLAIVVGIAYGADGLAVLAYFYFLAGAWFVFLLVWGRIARSAGRWNHDRIDGRP